MESRKVERDGKKDRRKHELNYRDAEGAEKRSGREVGSSPSSSCLVPFLLFFFASSVSLGFKKRM